MHKSSMSKFAFLLATLCLALTSCAGNGISLRGKNTSRGSDSDKTTGETTTSDTVRPHDAEAGAIPVPIMGTNLTMVCESLRAPDGSRAQVGCNFYISASNRFSGVIEGEAFQFINAQNQKVNQPFEINHTASAEYQVKAAYPANPDQGWALFSGKFDGKPDNILAQIGSYVRETSAPMNLFVNFASGVDGGACPASAPCHTISYAVGLIPASVLHEVTVKVTAAGASSNDVVLVSNKAIGPSGRISIVGMDKPVIFPVPIAEGAIVKVSNSGDSNRPDHLIIKGLSFRGTTGNIFSVYSSFLQLGEVDFSVPAAMGGLALDFDRSKVLFDDDAAAGVKRISITGPFAGGMNATGGSSLFVHNIDFVVDGPKLFGWRLMDMSGVNFRPMAAAGHHKVDIQNTERGIIAANSASLSSTESAATNRVSLNIKATEYAIQLTRSDFLLTAVDLDIDASTSSGGGHGIHASNSSQFFMDLGSLTTRTRGFLVVAVNSEIDFHRTSTFVRRTATCSDDATFVATNNAIIHFDSPGLDAQRVGACTAGAPSYTSVLWNGSTFGVYANNGTDPVQIADAGGNTFHTNIASAVRIAPTGSAACDAPTSGDFSRYFNCAAY